MPPLWVGTQGWCPAYPTRYTTDQTIIKTSSLFLPCHTPSRSLTVMNLCLMLQNIFSISFELASYRLEKCLLLKKCFPNLLVRLLVLFNDYSSRSILWASTINTSYDSCSISSIHLCVSVSSVSKGLCIGFLTFSLPQHFNSSYFVRTKRKESSVYTYQKY